MSTLATLDDPGIIAALGIKASQAHGIVDPLAAPAEQQSDATRIQRLAELYLAGRSHEATPTDAPSQAPAQPTFFDMAEVDAIGTRGAA